MEVKVVESELIQDVLFEIKYDEKYKYHLFVNGEWVDKRSWASLSFAYTFKDHVIRVLMDTETGILYPTLVEKQLHKGL